MRNTMAAPTSLLDRVETLETRVRGLSERLAQALNMLAGEQTRVRMLERRADANLRPWDRRAGKP